MKVARGDAKGKWSASSMLKSLGMPEPSHVSPSSHPIVLPRSALERTEGARLACCAPQ